MDDLRRRAAEKVDRYCEINGIELSDDDGFLGIKKQ